MRKISSIAFTMFLLLGLVACSDSSLGDIKVDEVISALKEADLEVENPTEMTKDDFGIAPMKSKEAKHFLIPSLGDDAGGRILSYENDEDLKQMKAYYDELGRESAMLYSHTATKDNILIQVNGDLEQSEFDKYEEVLNTLE